jgi:oxygen-independent coproporphyrinogen-3 oxidase
MDDWCGLVTTATPVYTREAALRSLGAIDPSHPEPMTALALQQPENAKLLEYVFADSFTHVFPGKSETNAASFLVDFARSIGEAERIHLWTYIPLCRYRCAFCQFPVLVLNARPEAAASTAARWVDENIREAQLWLAAVPRLGEVVVDEFCLYGGTPSAIPASQLSRLTDFYRSRFNLTQASMRVEGAPDSLTRPMLGQLRDLGFDTLTFGVQTFDDDLLRIANRRHTGDEARSAIAAARDMGFSRVDGDIVYGLPGQTVDGFASDVDEMIRLGFDSIVAIKLHLQSFHEVDHAVGNIRPAAWGNPNVRDKLARSGYAWPTLGQQYQMREIAVERLARSGRFEHPTTYFQSDAVGPERWRALNLDQDLQVPELGIGLGAYAWTPSSEAHMLANPTLYSETLAQGELPFETCCGMTEREQEARAVRMALSTCQPLRADVHEARFGRAFRGEHIGEVLDGLVERDLARWDGDDLSLTAVGKTLVESIMNVESWW